MNEQKLIALLGLAQKAGKIVSGELAIEKAVRSGKAGIILIAANATANSKKNYHDLSNYYEIKCYEVLSKEEFGTAIGKSARAALSIVDVGFSKAIGKVLCT
ncbi:MAG: ribosomal protein L7Ae/L30e/S12e/Gadd45 [Firmicutes bacterium]|nr:ribosomal protein L7Ae/L30e/S12e/Gadd45 [Bacillota bacterium]